MTIQKRKKNVQKGLLRAKKAFQRLQEAEKELMGEFGLVGTVNVGREIYEINRSLSELETLLEQVAKEAWVKGADKPRNMTNAELCCDLYDVILECDLPDKHATTITEAAKRLSSIELEGLQEIRNN